MLFLSTALYASQKDLSDKEITNAVDNELMFNSSTPAYLIDVSANEGIVTLSGSVNNILAKDRAEKIASAVKGVRGVIDRIEVDAPYRTDQALQRDVEDALLYDPATDLFELDVEVDDGKVTLEGELESWQEKQLAEYVVKGVKGVEKVRNDIEIDYSTDRSDYEIEQEVKKALRTDIRVDDALISAKVKNGKVTLTGTVGSNMEKYLAEADAWVAGVTSVNSQDLEVEKWARDEEMRKDKYVYKSDEKIKKAVEDAFLYDPRVFSFKPEVKVDNGVVTLTGKVDNLKAKRAAEEDAKNVVGVFTVRNYLKVRPVTIPNNDDLENDVSNALLRDPYVEEYEIEVEAENGVITLGGAVDSYFEKMQAEDVASRTKGTVAVNNNLVVDEDYDEYYYDYYGWNTYYPNYYIDVDDGYKTDWEIEESIKDELWWSPYVNKDEVNVYVLDGEATLTGTVDTEREKLFAEINALEGGASEVDNELEVEFLPEEE